MSQIRPIADEELTSSERVQAWMRETARILEIKEMVHYQPDEVFEPIEGAGDTLTLHATDPQEAVMNFLHIAFKIRKNRDFLEKCPVIFESALSLEDIEEMLRNGEGVEVYD